MERKAVQKTKAISCMNETLETSSPSLPSCPVFVRLILFCNTVCQQAFYLNYYYYFHQAFSWIFTHPQAHQTDGKEKGEERKRNERKETSGMEKRQRTCFYTLSFIIHKASICILNGKCVISGTATPTTTTTRNIPHNFLITLGS